MSDSDVPAYYPPVSDIPPVYVAPAYSMGAPAPYSSYIPNSPYELEDPGAFEDTENKKEITVEEYPMEVEELPLSQENYFPPPSYFVEPPADYRAAQPAPIEATDPRATAPKSGRKCINCWAGYCICWVIWLFVIIVSGIIGGITG